MHTIRGTGNIYDTVDSAVSSVAMEMSLAYMQVAMKQTSLDPTERNIIS